MAKQIINIGRTANDRSGDPLRTAFNKVNENFTELYSAIGADVQIPVQTNNGGKFLTTNGTTLSWSSISQEVGTANTGFVDDKIYNLNGLELGNDDLVHGATARLSLPANGDGTEVSLLNYYGGVGVYTGFNPSVGQGWIFENNGTLTVPSVGTRSFVAVLDTDHMYPQPGIAFDGTPWELNVQFQAQPDGSIQTIINQIFPRLDNPGYVSGHAFRFEEADHNIPGFTFDVILNNVVLPGGAGWTANIAVSQPPTYPSTVSSAGTIKLTSNNKSWTLGTDGNLTFPSNGTINNINSSSNPTGTIYTFINDGATTPGIDNNNVLYLDNTTDAQAIQAGWIITFANSTQKTVSLADIGLPPNAGKRMLQFTGSVTLADVDVWPLTVQSADYSQGVNITKLEITPEGTTTWSFDSNGVVSLPLGGDIVDSTGASVLGAPAVIDGGNASTTF